MTTKGDDSLRHFWNRRTASAPEIIKVLALIGEFCGDDARLWYAHAQGWASFLNEVAVYRDSGVYDRDSDDN